MNQVTGGANESSLEGASNGAFRSLIPVSNVKLETVVQKEVVHEGACKD